MFPFFLVPARHQWPPLCKKCEWFRAWRKSHARPTTHNKLLYHSNGFRGTSLQKHLRLILLQKISEFHCLGVDIATSNCSFNSLRSFSLKLSWYCCALLIFHLKYKSTHSLWSYGSDITSTSSYSHSWSSGSNTVLTSSSYSYAWHPMNIFFFLRVTAIAECVSDSRSSISCTIKLSASLTKGYETTT